MSLERTLWLVAAVTSASVSACSPAEDRLAPEDFIPQSASSVVLINPLQIAHDPVSATAMEWNALSDEVRALGLDPSAADRLALATVSTFEQSRGALVVLRPDGDVVIPPLSWSGSPAFVLEGLEFRATLQSGWYWTGEEGRWVAAADSVGCVLSAPTFAGDTPSLFRAPPQPTLEPLLASVSPHEPFAALLIPSGQTVSTMQAASTWASDISGILDLALPSELLRRIGVAHGLGAEGHDESGKIRLVLRVAMADEESAGFVAGTVNLVTGLGAGLEALARSLGDDPPPRPDVDLEMSCAQNLVLVRTLVPPSGTAGP